MDIITDAEQAWEVGRDVLNTVTDASAIDRILAGAAAVVALHEPIDGYELCEGLAGCSREDCTEDRYGDYVHTTIHTGAVCDHCVDSYEEPVPYPCDTIKALTQP